MADPYLGEIRVLSFQQIPCGWAPCNGQILPISQYQALFSLLGVVYGGNGTTNFALRDLGGRVAASAGPGMGLGAANGAAQVALTSAEIPAHTHTLNGSTTTAGAVSPAAGAVLSVADGLYSSAKANPTTLLPASVASAGASGPHENRMPFLALNFCIALTGIYPPRP